MSGPRIRVWTAAALLLLPAGAAAQSETVTLSSRDASQLAAWDLKIDARLAQGRLRLRGTWFDTLIAGRVHERLAQLHRGVPVFGGELVRQREGGRSRSLYGTLYEGIQVDPEPRLSAADARRIVAGQLGVEVGPRFSPDLLVLPLDGGGYALTYRLRAFTGDDLVLSFIDAHDGRAVLRYSELKTQFAVGLGRGVYGDDKKLSGERLAGRFVARDLLRPPSLETYDMQGDLNRTLLFLNGFLFLDDSDLASDSDNTWEDGANVDAHVYTGYFYDYLFERFGRRGLNDDDQPVTSIVHPVSRSDVFFQSDEIVNIFYLNAFYFDGIMVYGEGLPPGDTADGVGWTWFSAGLDVVGHELGHGVTESTSNLIYRNESGALNEAYSDILAAGVEFMFQEPGDGRIRADYLLGEDVVSSGAVRSMASPADQGNPDHYSVRFTGTQDNGGVHINSSIPNHAFYLAIEGGTNRVSGLSVEGVGGSNRAQIEQAFYRAFAFLMPPGADFSTARAATIQAADEMFGIGSAPARAIEQAWTAVGVQ